MYPFLQNDKAAFKRERKYRYVGQGWGGLPWEGLDPRPGEPGRSPGQGAVSPLASAGHTPEAPAEGRLGPEPLPHPFSGHIMPVRSGVSK